MENEARRLFQEIIQEAKLSDLICEFQENICDDEWISADFSDDKNSSSNSEELSYNQFADIQISGFEMKNTQDPGSKEDMDILYLEIFKLKNLLSERNEKFKNLVCVHQFQENLWICYSYSLFDVGFF